MAVSKHGKITMRQAAVLYLVMLYTANIRILPKYSVSQAKQAAWLTPVVSMVFIILLALVIRSIVTKYPEEGFGEIICKILGKPIGKFTIVIYIMWISTLLSLYIRYFGERFVSTIYTEVNINVFIIIMLVVVGLTLRAGIHVLARMNKIIILFVTVQFFVIVLLLTGSINIKYLTPISSLDIIPVLKGCLGSMGIWVYLFYFFMISDEIMTSKLSKIQIIWPVIFMFSVCTLIIVYTLGSFGAETMVKLPMPFMMLVKNISVSGKFSGMEALFLSFWMLADFVTISLFTYIVLKLIKSLFNLKSSLPLLSIMLIFQFVSSKFLAIEAFELQSFSSKFALHMNVLTGFCMPLLFFAVGKIRKKL